MAAHDDWPWRETRLQRHDRIAALYRDTLLEHAPTECRKLDALLDTYNQHWITGHRPLINTAEPMTAGEIALWCDTRINNITNMIAARGIQPIGKRNGRKTYWLRQFDNTPQDVAI